MVIHLNLKAGIIWIPPVTYGAGYGKILWKNQGGEGSRTL
jgi:hypothetical protein